MLHRILYGFLLISSAVGCLGQKAVKGSRPNIVFIMVDDLGYGDLGCFGQSQIKTPNLDQMAAEGMRFTDFYAGCTVCRPSRISLWTGKHMGNTPISSNAQFHFRTEDLTIAEVLQTAGYKTGGVGKWANGNVDNSGHPNKQGFDFWMGYLDQGRAHNYYPTHLWLNSEKVRLPGNELLDHPNARGRVSRERVTYSHDVMTDHAFDFIRSHHAEPFLLHIHWTIPHANNEGGRVTGDGMEVPSYGEYEDRDWPNTAKGQAAMISRMDRDVGRLFALLKELRIDRKTLVFFTSDNGPHSEGGHSHEFFDSNGPLRGYKRDLYEGGIRVPAIAWWPGKVSAGSFCSEPFGFWDYFPTATELVGIEKAFDVDGLSFLPSLIGKPQVPHGELFWRFGEKAAIREQHWKAVRLKRGAAVELYDLRLDLGERNNVASRFPEVALRLTQKMERYIQGE